ncbi:hypothetical protein B0T20DRAFT_397051 [Sordaria brevicollis]|uniref:Uncharacterized protein n=1 Tax=Sordaria brevicollis TaxID=83679 RepID=A0AAE0P1J3_SORBR|nr:hypothetical protein B0T20DRAFT_397051 [Sordaria brevicollis]
MFKWKRAGMQWGQGFKGHSACLLWWFWRLEQEASSGRAFGGGRPQGRGDKAPRRPFGSSSMFRLQRACNGPATGLQPRPLVYSVGTALAPGLPNRQRTGLLLRTRRAPEAHRESDPKDGRQEFRPLPGTPPITST